MPGPLSDQSISGEPISGNGPASFVAICLMGALGGAPIGSVPLSDSCDAAPPVPAQGVCQTGALGGFALGGIAISGYDCPQPVPPSPPSGGDSGGHGQDWRPTVSRNPRSARVQQDLTTMRKMDEEIIPIWLAQFLAENS